LWRKEGGRKEERGGGEKEIVITDYAVLPTTTPRST
jgi:hypothetical protein